MDKLRLVKEVPYDADLRVAAINAIIFFKNERTCLGALLRARQLGIPVEQATVMFLSYRGIEVEVFPTDTETSLVGRWKDAQAMTNAEVRRVLELRQLVLENREGFADLLSKLGTTLELGTGAILDWIVRFSKQADDTVVECFGKEVLDAFAAEGFKPRGFQTLGAIMAQAREVVLVDKNAYGQHVIDLFLNDLSQGYALERDFETANTFYEGMTNVAMTAAV